MDEETLQSGREPLAKEIPPGTVGDGGGCPGLCGTHVVPVRYEGEPTDDEPDSDN